MPNQGTLNQVGQQPTLLNNDCLIIINWTEKTINILLFNNLVLMSNKVGVDVNTEYQEVKVHK